MSEDFIKRIIDKAAYNLGYISVKGLQYKVISEVLNGHEVFAILPMEFGKSLTHMYHRYIQNPKQNHSRIHHFV